jgi:DNA mismatch repair protein MSH5
MLNVPGDINDVTGQDNQRGNLLRLAGWINVDSVISVGCAGAVLIYLQRKLSLDRGGGEGLAVNSVEMFSLKGTMSVSSHKLGAR